MKEDEIDLLEDIYEDVDQKLSTKVIIQLLRDLETALKKEKEAANKCEQLTAMNEILKKQNALLVKKNDILTTNISCLYATAKSEIERHVNENKTLKHQLQCHAASSKRYTQEKLANFQQRQSSRQSQELDTQESEQYEQRDGENQEYDYNQHRYTPRSSQEFDEKKQQQLLQQQQYNQYEGLQYQQQQYQQQQYQQQFGLLQQFNPQLQFLQQQPNQYFQGYDHNAYETYYSKKTQ